MKTFKNCGRHTRRDSSALARRRTSVSGSRWRRSLCLRKTAALTRRVCSQSIQCSLLAAGHLGGLFGGSYFRLGGAEEVRRRKRGTLAVFPKSAGQSLPRLLALNTLLCISSVAFFTAATFIHPSIRWNSISRADETVFHLSLNPYKWANRPLKVRATCATLS